MPTTAPVYASEAPGSFKEAPGYGQDQENSWHSLLRSGQLGSKQSKPNIWEIILLPWVVLGLILLCASFADLKVTFLLWLPSVVIIGLGCVFTYMEVRGRRTGEAILGALCILAACVGLCASLYAYNRWLGEYYRLGAGAHYNNVAPTDSAAGYNDATTIDFTEGSRVDDSRTFGYMDSINRPHDVYCVAPIVVNPDATQQVQFWAAGRNCCYQRTQFSCGHVEDPSVHGGVVLKGPYPQGFQDAVSGAEYSYGMQSAKNFLLVSWVEDAGDTKDRLWKRTQNFFIVFAGAYLLLSAMLGWSIMSLFK